MFKKVLKVFGIILLVAAILLALWYGIVYLLYFADVIGSPTVFDRDMIRQFGKWERIEQGEPDMYLPAKDREYTIFNYEVYHDSDEYFCYLVDVKGGKIVSIAEGHTGEPMELSDVDLSEYLHDGRLCDELYGVDPDNFIEDLRTVSFKYAGYSSGPELMSHKYVYFRGIDTGKYDYHISAQELNWGHVGVYEDKVVWGYANPMRSKNYMGEYYETHEEYLSDSFFDLIDMVRHWDGESIIVSYCPRNNAREFIYDIEINPELDDYLFTPESLLRYHKHEFYRSW